MEAATTARNLYVVAYDVADPQRLTQAYKTMLGYGDHVQYSVFLCNLSRIELARLKESLAEILNYGEDRILVVDTGPSYGTGPGRIETIGAALPTGGREASFVV